MLISSKYRSNIPNENALWYIRCASSIKYTSDFKDVILNKNIMKNNIFIDYIRYIIKIILLLLLSVATGKFKMYR